MSNKLKLIGIQIAQSIFVRVTIQRYCVRMFIIDVVVRSCFVAVYKSNRIIKLFYK